MDLGILLQACILQLGHDRWAHRNISALSSAMRETRDGKSRDSSDHDQTHHRGPSAEVHVWSSKHWFGAYHAPFVRSMAHFAAFMTRIQAPHCAQVRGYGYGPQSATESPSLEGAASSDPGYRSRAAPNGAARELIGLRNSFPCVRLPEHVRVDGFRAAIEGGQLVPIDDLM
jgi:hypothetical protein